MGDDNGAAPIDDFPSSIIEYSAPRPNPQKNIFTLTKMPSRFIFLTEPLPMRFYRRVETIVREVS